MKVAREHNAFFIRNKIDGNQLAIAKKRKATRDKKKAKNSLNDKKRRDGNKLPAPKTLNHPTYVT